MIPVNTTRDRLTGTNTIHDHGHKYMQPHTVRLIIQYLTMPFLKASFPYIWKTTETGGFCVGKSVSKSINYIILANMNTASPSRQEKFWETRSFYTTGERFCTSGKPDHFIRKQINPCEQKNESSYREADISSWKI